MWTLSRDDVPTRRFQKIDSIKSMFAIFFTGKKLVLLDSLSKSQNTDSYDFCKAVLQEVKAGALAGMRKSMLRHFHLQ
jgi:hypothetical protein